MTRRAQHIRTQAISAAFAVGMLLYSQSPFASARGLLETLREGDAAPGQVEHWIDAIESEPTLRSTLTGSGTFTLFVPNDQAFEDLYALDACGAIQLNENLLRTLLNHHVVRGTAVAAGPGARHAVRTRLGAPISVDAEEVYDTVGATARFDGPAIEAANGVAHVIDRFLWPYPAPSCS
jgi:uncharacterized surface protein with fasciclin (FAS1) repeats